MKTTVSLTGMHCASCVLLIKDASKEFPDIRHVDVDLGKNTVTIDHTDALNLDAWKREIEGLGYRVDSIRTAAGQ